MNKERIEYIYQWLQGESEYMEKGAPDARRLEEACSELRLDLLAGEQTELVGYLNTQALFFVETIKCFSKSGQKEKTGIQNEVKRKCSDVKCKEIVKKIAIYYCMEEEYEDILHRKKEVGIEETIHRIAKLAQMGHYKSGVQLAFALNYAGYSSDAAEILQGLIRRRGDIDAYSMLGDLYLLGKGVDRNADKACVCYEHAAGLGHAGAMKAVADMNFHGGIISHPVFETASKWYHKAAHFGDQESMYLAGVCDLLYESEKNRPKYRSEEVDLQLWQSGKELLTCCQDQRGKELLWYVNRRFPRRENIPVMTVRELYERLCREERTQKYIYRGQTKKYQPPLRPSAFRRCQYSKFAMEGNPAHQVRNWGREFYLEVADCENIFGDEGIKKKHAVMRMMSVYMNNVLGYPLTQALLQQAGYASEGLDVSYDLRIALFFALYKLKDGRYYRKEAGGEPSVIYRWKLPKTSFSLQDNYYSKANFIPSFEILSSFGVCKDAAESRASLNRYLQAIGWGSLYFDLPERRPFELIRIPEESLTRSRIALQKGALLIPDIIPGSKMLQTHKVWGNSTEVDKQLEYNLVQDLSDPLICDSFLIDCSNLKDDDFNILNGLPSPDEIYSKNQNDISHILTYLIFEKAYDEAMNMGTIPIDFTPVMPAYGVSYLDALALLEEWNQQRKKGQYFYIF